MTQNDKSPATRHLFGTDGIRGVANEHPMTPELALQLGRAVTFVAGRGKTHTPRILIGKDTRLSCYMLETALASGVCSMGGEVTLCGPLPTPAVAHLTSSMRVDAGVVISASHNPYEDNGIKIFATDGFKLPDEAEAEIERLMADQSLMGARHTGSAIGRAEKLDDARGRYVAFAKNTFPRDLSLDGVRIVVDAANGAAYRVAPLVFDELGADVTALGVKPNGININEDSGALHPENVQGEVIKRRAHIGIALDGDADRVIVIDERGQVVDGDAVMAMCAQGMARDGQLKNGAVVATVMSNLGLERGWPRWARSWCAPRGDRYVVEAMRRAGPTWRRASGHLLFRPPTPATDHRGPAGAALMMRTGRSPRTRRRPGARAAGAGEHRAAAAPSAGGDGGPGPGAAACGERPGDGGARARALERHRGQAAHHAGGARRAGPARLVEGAGGGRGPRRGGPLVKREDFGLLLLRLTGLGLSLVHGLPKLTELVTGQSHMAETVAKLGFPLPGVFAWAAALGECAGGLLVALGLFTRVGAALAAFTMFVAAFLQHHAFTRLLVNLRLRYLPEETLKAWGNPELALMYLAVLLAVLIMGPGRIALDSMFGTRGRR